MLRPAKWLALVAACGGLSACATYDYGYPSSYYGYSAPYYGYSYDYGPTYYDYGYAPYYYGWGPSYYVGPSVGFDFRYRDRDRFRSDRRHTGSRSGDHRVSRNATATAPTVQRRGVTPPSRGQVRAAPVARVQGGRTERPANRSDRGTLRAEQ
jgi:hypothetical protein